MPSRQAIEAFSPRVVRPLLAVTNDFNELQALYSSSSYESLVNTKNRPPRRFSSKPNIVFLKLNALGGNYHFTT